MIGRMLTAVLGWSIVNYAACQWGTLSTGMNHGVRELFFDQGSGRLYAVGSFTTAGDSTTNGVAWWDGTAWHPLGAGMEPLSPVLCLAKQGEEIVAGGYFDFAVGVENTEHIAVWNGSAWGGATDAGGCDGLVLELDYIDSVLYAGGNFTSMGTISVPYLVRRVNGDWQGIITNEQFMDQQHIIATIARYQDELFVGGNFLTESGLRDLGMVQGDLLAEVGGGVHGDSWVNDMVVFNGLLYVAGYFYEGGGNVASMVMCWDGTQWLDPFPQVDIDAQVRDMVVHEGALYFTGRIRPVGGGLESYLARYDGDHLCLLGGQNSYVSHLSVGNGFVYCATSTDWLFGPDSLDVNFIAAYDLGYPPDTCINIVQGVPEARSTLQPLTITPNPVEDSFSIGQPVGDVRWVHLRDALGRLMLVQRYRQSNFDVAHLSGGVYQLLLIDAQDRPMASGRFVKK